MTIDLLPELLELEQADGGDDRDCHLLDDQGRALCFANIAGRRVHDPVDGTSWRVSGDFIPVCGGCRRPRCATCAEIQAILTNGPGAA